MTVTEESAESRDDGVEGARPGAGVAERGQRPEGEPGQGIVHAFGRMMKLMRVRAGLQRDAFGAQLGYSASSIASFEQGRRIPPPRFIERADRVLDAGGVLEALKEEVARAQYPAFFRDAARLEGEAVALHVYATKAVPGLLQTERYAHAVFAMWRPLLSDETVGQRVTARLTRQEIFDRAPMPTISFIIEEAVLRRPLGGRDVMRGQLEQIRRFGMRRNVEIQVLPTELEEHAGIEGPFTLIETHDGQRIAYVETYKDSRLHTERASVREIDEQYGILRAQALTPRESLTTIERLLEER